MFRFKLGKQRLTKPTMQLSNADCVLAMRNMKENSISSIVTLPNLY